MNKDNYVLFERTSQSPPLKTLPHFLLFFRISKLDERQGLLLQMWENVFGGFPSL